MEVTDAIKMIEEFKGNSLTFKIKNIENKLSEQQAKEVADTNASFGVTKELLTAALAIKQASAQIDVLVHAVCIAFLLPYLLEKDEKVISVALGADNANSEFDLVTDRRIAEFKFISWKPKGNAVREKTLFGDYVKLSRAVTDKKKYLYLLDSEIPLRFLEGKRNIEKTLDNNSRILALFTQEDREVFQTVGQYYQFYREKIQVVNLLQEVPEIKDIMKGIIKALES